MANYSNGAISVTATPTVVLAARGRRQGLIVQNKGTQDVYYGPDISITTANTVSIPAGGYLNMSDKKGLWRGTLYGVVASGTADVRFWEWGE